MSAGFDKAQAADSIAVRTTETAAGNVNVWMLPTEVRDVVSFRGSFLTAPDLSSDDDIAQDMTANLLDKGTTGRDRFAVAEALEDRGAQLSFYSDTLRVGFAGKALRDDLPFVLEMLAEQLREPLFDGDEFVKERARSIANVQHALDSTGSQASTALKNIIFDSSHPNHSRRLEDELEGLQAITPDRVKDFHAQHFGATGLKIAFAGDLDERAILDALQKHLGDWSPHALEAVFSTDSIVAPDRANIPMPDKQNVDVRMGHAVDVRRDSIDFLPLYVANAVLGGNFSARLMQIVRDEMGLTYGVGSTLAGIAVEHTGYWKIVVSLSTENLERGLAATTDVVQNFVAEGISADELEEKKTNIAGEHVVGLATTRGLATRLLVNAERGFPTSYVDAFPELVRALRLDDVNRAIQKHFKPDQLTIAVAGTLPDRSG